MHQLCGLQTGYAITREGKTSATLSTRPNAFSKRNCCWRVKKHLTAEVINVQSCMKPAVLLAHYCFPHRILFLHAMLAFHNDAYARCRLWDSIHNSNASCDDTSTSNQKACAPACLPLCCLSDNWKRPWQTPWCCHLQDATVDECGVCGGLSDSCAILVQAQLQLTPATLQVCCPALPCRYAALPCPAGMLSCPALCTPILISFHPGTVFLLRAAFCFCCYTDVHAKLSQQ